MSRSFFILILISSLNFTIVKADTQLTTYFSNDSINGFVSMPMKLQHGRSMGD